MTKKRIMFGAGAIVLVLLGYWWYWQSGTGTTATKYVTATAEKGTLVISVSGSGNVAVDQIANVDPTVTGTVADLSVKIGESVKKGQKLFAIVNDQLGVNVEQAAASLQSAENSLYSAKIGVRQAKATLEAVKKTGTSTYRQKVVMEKQIRLAEDGVSAAEKSASASRASYRKILADASKRVVTSPIDGTVSEVNIKNGDDLANVSSGSSRVTPIIIGDLGTLKASVAVNEVDIPNVAVGQKASFTFNALPSITLTGKVQQIDSLGSITQGVVTYDVTIGFDSLDTKIKPNMSVSASIVTRVLEDVVSVPTGAIKSNGNGGNFVRVLSGKGTTPEDRPVTVGESNNTHTEITSGLSGGEKVVTSTVNAADSSSASGSSVRIPGLGGFGGRRD